MPTLNEIKTAVSSKLAAIDKKGKKASEDEKVLGFVLERLQQILNENEVEKAIIFLQGVSTQGDIVNTLSKKLIGQKKDILKYEGTTSFTEQTAIVKDVSFLIQIHKDLMHNYALPPIWHYSYPKDKNEEVNDAFVLDWERSMQKLADSKSYVDFTRGFTIKDQKPKYNNEEEFNTIVDKLIDETKYDSEENRILKTWFKHNAGQGMHSLLIDSVKNFHFIGEKNEKDLLDFPNVTRVQAIKSNWFIKNGELYLEDVILAKAIETKRFSQYLAADKNNKIRPITNLDDDFDNIMTALQSQDNFEKMTPLLGARVLIRLDVKNGVATPKVVDYRVTSYTKLLNTPEEQLKKQEQLALSVEQKPKKS